MREREGRAVDKHTHTHTHIEQMSQKVGIVVLVGEAQASRAVQSSTNSIDFGCTEAAMAMYKRAAQRYSEYIAALRSSSISNDSDRERIDEMKEELAVIEVAAERLENRMLLLDKIREQDKELMEAKQKLEEKEHELASIRNQVKLASREELKGAAKERPAKAIARSATTKIRDTG